MHPYYITTPIYYVNDKPHIGHCYTTVLADVAARFQRLIRGDSSSVFFLTGTDEHADKVVTSALEHKTTPQAWADQNAAAFKEAFAFMGVSNNDFIRTSEPRHKDKVTQYITELQKTGDVYKGEYTGWYDVGQEEYVTETTARENNFHSAINKKPLVKRTEPCYFFKLSKYQQRLLQHIELNPHFLRPDSRRSEVLGRLKPPAVLNDIPISRPVTEDPSTQWGIRIPGDPANRIYVWIDALFNYLSTVDTPERKQFWPPAVHLIGKDILWFHAVIWPCMLIAMDRPLPTCVFGHGWWISEGEKMSKSLGNFIDLAKLKAYAARYSLDGLRWYLSTQGPMSGSDADFSHAKFVEVYNADLANGIGNCASRVSNMIAKYFDGKLPARPSQSKTPSHDWPALASAAAKTAISRIDSLDLAGSLAQGTDLIKQVDGYINITEPFKLAKKIEAEPALRDQLASILYNCAEGVRIASLLFSPAMPTKMADLWNRWNCTPPAGVPLAELCEWAGPHSLKPGAAIEKGDALFMRADAAEAPPT